MYYNTKIERCTAIEKENVMLFTKIKNIIHKKPKSRLLATVASRSSHDRSGRSIDQTTPACNASNLNF